MALVRYSAVRLLLLLGAAGVLYLVGLRGALLWVGAVAVAGLVAFIALPRSHDRAAADLARLLHRPPSGEEDEDEDEDEDGAREPGPVSQDQASS